MKLYGGTVFSRDKLAELILFFVRRHADDNGLTVVKLNRLLFLADFSAYGYLGKSITGMKYIRQEHGPAPDPEQFSGVLQELVETGRLLIKE